MWIAGPVVFVLTASIPVTILEVARLSQEEDETSSVFLFENELSI
jgi:hypothetical protein